MLISNAYAQTAAAAGPMDSVMQFLPIILMFAVLYFLMVRPQMKKAKAETCAPKLDASPEHKALIDGLGKGDEIVTQGGMAGRITKVGDDFISVEIAEKVEIQIQKPAISLVLPKGTLKNL